jgi:hypothetical protein
MRRLLPLVLVLLVSARGAAAAVPQSAELGPATLKASAPFYAALVASAHGNIDATNRQLLLLAARWDAAVTEARASGPAALTQDPAWGAALDRATALLARARELARGRDVAGAHGELEEMRLLLHEVRERHAVWTLDDRLAEYHEMMERVTGHVSGPSEINLTVRDYQDVDEDLAAARASWAHIDQLSAGLQGAAAWRSAAADTASALQDAVRAVAARRRSVLAQAVERLKTSYFELLSALAKSRG